MSQEHHAAELSTPPPAEPLAELRTARCELLELQKQAAQAVRSLGKVVAWFGDADSAETVDVVIEHATAARQALDACKKPDGTSRLDGSYQITVKADERLLSHIDVATMAVPPGVSERMFHVRATGEATPASVSLRRNHPPAAGDAVEALRVAPIPAAKFERRKAAAVLVPVTASVADDAFVKELASQLAPLDIRVSLRMDQVVLVSKRSGVAAGFTASLHHESAGAWELAEQVHGSDVQVRIDGRPVAVAGARAEYRHDAAHLMFNVVPVAPGTTDARQANACRESTLVASGGWTLPIEQTPTEAGWRPSGQKRAMALPRLVLGLADLGPDTLGMSDLPLAAITAQDLTAGGSSSRKLWHGSANVALKQCILTQLRLTAALVAIDQAVLGSVQGATAACRGGTTTRPLAA